MEIKRTIVFVAAVLLSACSSMTTISSPKEGTTLLLKDKSVALPYHESMKGTSFGNYVFKAVDAAGADPLYGVLPLRFKGGHLAVDIIFFAPAAFFNLREVFPFYEIDVAGGVIRYRNAPNEGWTEYRPKPEEVAHAHAFFDTKPAAVVGSH